MKLIELTGFTVLIHTNMLENSGPNMHQFFSPFLLLFLLELPLPWGGDKEGRRHLFLSAPPGARSLGSGLPT